MHIWCYVVVMVVCVCFSLYCADLLYATAIPLLTQHNKRLLIAAAPATPLFKATGKAVIREETFLKKHILKVALRSLWTKTKQKVCQQRNWQYKS